MNILAIESASTVCGVALFLNNRLIELDEIRQSRIHGARLPVIIYDILNNYSALSESFLVLIEASSNN